MDREQITDPENNADPAPVDRVVLPNNVPFEIVTGEVTKDGAFILVEEWTNSLHIGWWCEKMKTWTTEINEARFDVGRLTPVAKIVCR